MKIYMVWGQRRCAYPDQYAPELLEAVSEYDDEDNPEIIDNTFKKYSDDALFGAIQIIEAEIDNDFLAKVLEVKPIKADLKDVHII